MLRSFSYAAYAALFISADGRPDELERLEPWARTWARWSGAAFLSGYLGVAGDAPAALLDLFLIDKALYELNYELNNRPDWVRIPLRGLSELVPAP
jgi:maltose alpha-D-glucosyltransferase/alpha-amylase